MSIRRFWGPPLVLTAMLGLAGCGGASVGTHVPNWAGGLPPGAPPPAAKPPPFPNVYDTPPARSTKLMSEQEQAKAEAELRAVRAKVETQTGGSQKERPGGKR